jgi:hypothetical protein
MLSYNTSYYGTNNFLVLNVCFAVLTIAKYKQHTLLQSYWRMSRAWDP